MKKIEKETKSFVTMFVAVDGTEFRTEEECKKYEESARGVINIKYKKLVVKSGSEDVLSLIGSEEHTVDVVKVKAPADVETVMQMYFLINPHLLKSDNNGWVDRASKLSNRALEDDDLLLIGRGYSDDECFWFIGTRKSMQEDIEKFCKTNGEKKED